MSTPDELNVDRLREKFPRSYKALVQLYPFAWDGLLSVIEEAMESGKTASVIAGRLSILRGLERTTRRWVVLSIAADRKEVLLRGQRSFLTQLYDKSLEDILAELRSLEVAAEAGAITPTAPHDHWPRGYAFISHHSKSTGRLAKSIAEGIEAAGGDCWVAPRNIRDGFDWNDEVYGAAQRCGALVVLYSREALRSKQVKGEIHIAVGRGIPIFVVKMDDGDPAALNVGLAAYQHIDWVGRPAGDLHQLIARLRVQIDEAYKMENAA